LRYGISTFVTDTDIHPVALAKAVEGHGFERLWLAEHSHIPVSRRTPWGGRDGAPPLPSKYWRTHDIFVAMGAMAAVTTTLRLGSGIALVAQRDPIWLAKQVASLDTLSSGRFDFGIGYGWNIEEMESHQANAKQRRAVTRERMLAMMEIFSKEEAEFHGAHVDFEPMWALPKPVQQPSPPIFIGAAPTPVTFKHIVEYADGWVPISGRFPIEDRIADLRQLAEDAGRDPAEIAIGVYNAPPKASVLESLRDAGVDFSLLSLESTPEDQTLETLGGLAELAAEVG
jgi:probable F420-dependent oxidoreductase